MKHIITLHYATQHWFEIQKNHIEKYTTKKEDYIVYLATYKCDLPTNFTLPPNYKHIRLDDYVQNNNILIRNVHHEIIEYVYNIFVVKDCKDDDIIVYLDSDAFPCDYWENKIEMYFNEHDIASVYRYEDIGPDLDKKYFPCPHLCFFSFIKEKKEKHKFVFDITPPFQCPGTSIRDVAEQNNLKIKEMIRTNKFDLNRVMFGVYDDIIYHQSSGSRGVVGRPYKSGACGVDKSRHCFEGIDYLLRPAIPHDWINTKVGDISLKIFDMVYDEIKNDNECTFIKKYFIGKP